MTEDILACKRMFTLLLRRNSFEPRREKTNKVACAPSTDPDQTMHLPSLIRVFLCALKVAKGLSYRLMPRRITVFACRTCHIVGFVVSRLIYDFYLRPFSIFCLDIYIFQFRRSGAANSSFGVTKALYCI